MKEQYERKKQEIKQERELERKKKPFFCTKDFE